MSDDGGIFNFKFEWDTKEVETELTNWDHNVTKAVTHAMVEDVESLLGKSMRIAPIDEGTMIGSASAKVQEVEIAHGNDDGSISQVGSVPSVTPGSVIKGTVSYNTPYAARQHEELGYKHKEGKQAKYLETPLKENVQKYTKNIADAIKGVRK
jgi:hypothetical protein